MKRPRFIRFGLIAAAVFIGSGILLSVTASKGQSPSKFNKPGNILITDQFNNRVIEIDPSGNIVWQFGSGPGNITPSAIIGTNDAERVNDLTLMSGTGIPPAPTSTTHCKKGCVDNRVLLVDRRGNIVWQYGEFGVTGAGFNQLNTPVQNTYLPQSNGDDHILITDQGNGRIIEVRRSDKVIVWEYDNLNNPNAAELLTNGNVLISDENNNQAIEVTHVYGLASSIVPGQVFTTAGGTLFSGVAFASRLSNGHTLITDSNNSRIVETDVAGDVFWQYFTNNRPGSNSSPLPTRAVRLANGDTLVSDQFNHQVIRVNTSGDIVASYGTINDPGFNPTTAVVMNGPYSAYVIGDYTGITPPF
jgi:hypothetical protein